MDHGPGWRTRNPSIERHANAALAVVYKRHSPRRVRKLRIRSFSIYHRTEPNRRHGNHEAPDAQSHQGLHMDVFV